MCGKTVLLGELTTLCVIPLGEDDWKFVLGLSLILSYAPFAAYKICCIQVDTGF